MSDDNVPDWLTRIPVPVGINDGAFVHALCDEDR